MKIESCMRSDNSMHEADMANYVISDIHGALDEFRKLLDKIDFRFDGTDSLYLLGDYCDWGRDSLATLQYVKELDDEYPFVHCLIGNHEWMFLGTIRAEEKGSRGLDENEQNWFFANRGLGTWTEYEKLAPDERNEIAEWIGNLQYSAETVVNGKRYLMSHAFPYFSDMTYNAVDEARHKTDAVWRRLMIRENPFGFYEGPKHYDVFICGHTISEYYFYKLQYERSWPERKPDQHVFNRIFHAERFIDIDCGAKCFDCTEDPDAGLRHGAERAQLSCIRLEDGWECYVHPVHHRLSDVEIPELDMPDVTLPEFGVQGMKLPGIDISGMKVPDVAKQVSKISSVRLPQLRFPSIELPGFRKNNSVGGDGKVPDVGGVQ